ncbi:hypothetical protein ACFV5E_05920 [Streptomyces chartreusis]|uniref:hypothetical protein n=1 Tax=Streptomyces chartreusis TaxID=1969 RepID=UPI003692D04F
MRRTLPDAAEGPVGQGRERLADRAGPGRGTGPGPTARSPSAPVAQGRPAVTSTSDRPLPVAKKPGPGGPGR